MRRPPLGPVPPTAHDMAREFRWLSAVHPGLSARAARLCCSATIPSIVGSIFYVMERRRGVVVRHEEPPELQGSAGHAAPRRRRRSSTRSPICIAIDVERAGLTHLGKPLGFVERQVRGWTDRWQRSKTTDAAGDGRARSVAASTSCRQSRAAGDRARRLQARQPDARRRSSPIAIVAVFDWEMSALGDPLVDLGILLAYWVPTAPPESARRADDGHEPARVVHARRSGRALRGAQRPRPVRRCATSKCSRCSRSPSSSSRSTTASSPDRPTIRGSPPSAIASTYLARHAAGMS